MFLALLIPLLPWLAKRVLISLGIGIVTYAASTAMLNIFVNQVTASMSATGGVVLQMASLFGVPDSIGIILGAYSTNASLAAIKRFALL